MKEDISDVERAKFLKTCKELGLTESEVVAAMIRSWLKDPLSVSIDLDVPKRDF